MAKIPSTQLFPPFLNFFNRYPHFRDFKLKKQKINRFKPDTVASTGGYRYDNGAVYVGCWNSEGKRHGEGHLLLPDGTRYDGYFEDNEFNGLGVLHFPDGAKYEGEFFQGWFHGYGVFWRADGLRHEGEYRGGKIWGLGITTFSDNTNGFPKNEGYFENCQLKKPKKCSDIVQRAQRMAFMARNKYIDSA